MWFYDEAQLLGDTGEAVFELGMRGVLVEEADRRLSTGAAMHGSDRARSAASTWQSLQPCE